jgi:NhaP-type Na+/H+ or K+/H+ antiporter
VTNLEKNNLCRICIAGIFFALLEIFIVIGESLGWIDYNMDLDSFLFIIFLIFIVSYQNKNENKKMEVKKFE